MLFLQTTFGISSPQPPAVPENTDVSASNWDAVPILGGD